MSRIAIIGAGMSGMCMAIRLDAAGFSDFAVYEKAATVGGTWRDNTYPGVACDVPSHLYSYSFATNPDWSHTYSPGWEIQAYCERCADEFGIRSRIRCGNEVVAARYDGSAWTLSFADGSAATADILVSGAGGLHHPKYPQIPGMERFAGAAFHSARWDHDRDLTGRRVAVIGSAASAVQIVPRIADSVAQLSVFQRTPNWIVPRRDRAYSSMTRRLFRSVPGLERLYRWLIYAVLEGRWPAFRQGSLMNRIARSQALSHLKRQVRDPELRACLTPDYPPGCKRVLISDEYYPALQRDNVDLVTTPIDRIEADAVVTADGRRHAVDTIVYATGFKVFDAAAGMDIVGPGELSLSDYWRDGIRAHRTVAVPGFPNLFLLLGPNSGLGHNSVIFMIEAQVRYVIECLRAMQDRGWRSIEARPEAFRRYQDELQASMRETIWESGCNSWYQDASGRIFTLWPRSTVSYWRTMREPDLDEYRGSAGP